MAQQNTSSYAAAAVRAATARDKAWADKERAFHAARVKTILLAQGITAEPTDAAIDALKEITSSVSAASYKDGIEVAGMDWP